MASDSFLRTKFPPSLSRSKEENGLRSPAIAKYHPCRNDQSICSEMNASEALSSMIPCELKGNLAVMAAEGPYIPTNRSVESKPKGMHAAMARPNVNLLTRDRPHGDDKGTPMITPEEFEE